MTNYQEINNNLIKEYQNGNKNILNDIITVNSNLVMSIARKYENKIKNSIITIDDLYQEGCLGLIRAVELYNEDKGIFSSYAVKWIKSKIEIYIACDNLKGLSIPSRNRRIFARINSLISFYEEKYNKTPTYNDLYPFIKDYASDEILKNVWEILGYQEINLDNTLSCNTDTKFEDIIYDESKSSFTDDSINKMIISEIFKILDDREKYILINRFYYEKTLQNLSEDLNISKEAVRKIELNACQRAKIYLDYGIIVKNAKVFLKYKKA